MGNSTNLLNNPLLKPLLNLISTFCIVVTAIVAWFALITSRRANKLQLLPLISIFFEGNTLRERKIQVKNIGKNPAYNIKIEHFLLIFRDVQKIWRLDLKLSGTNVLEVGEKRDLLLKGTINGKEADVKDFLIFHLDPDKEHERRRARLVVTFRNALSDYFFIEIETGVGGLFIGPAREMNIISKIYLIYKKAVEYIFVSYYKLLWRFRDTQN